MSLSRKQTALIHVAKKQLDMSDERYREVLWKMADVESSKDLDQEGFESVMQGMAYLGFKSEVSKNFLGWRVGMATPPQVKFIRNLWREYTGGKGDEKDLGKWLERTFKVSSLRFLNDVQAPKAITALKAMKARKIKKSKTG